MESLKGNSLLVSDILFDGLNNDKNRKHKIIISLTTYPARIDTVHIVLKQMLRQTLKPDRILLWLCDEQFPNKELPDWVELYKHAGIEFCFCPVNLKPHTKYYYTIKENPNALVITVDDDIFYDEYLVEKLYNSYMQFPNAISAMRTHKIVFDRNDHICSYLRWKYECSDQIAQPSMKLFATGVGGVLYPPNSLHPEVFNLTGIKNTCLYNDDLWLKVMSLLQGTPVVLVECCKQLRYIPGTQECEETLSLSNNIGRRNDLILTNILQHYNEYYGKDDTVEKRIQTMYQTVDDRFVGFSDFFEKKGIKKKAIYTTITEDYDFPKLPRFINDDWDYICFTNNLQLNSDFWKIVPMEESELDSVKKSMCYKILPHKYMNGYDCSLWINSDFVVLNDVNEIIVNYSQGGAVLCFNEYTKDCIYDEMLSFISMKKSDSNILIKQIKKYIESGYPRHNGLADTCILYREHNDPRVIQVMEDWWYEYEVQNYSILDKYSFNYACWKNSFKYDTYISYFDKSEYFSKVSYISDIEGLRLALVWMQVGLTEPMYCEKTVDLKNGRFNISYSVKELENIKAAYRLFFWPPVGTICLEFEHKMVCFSNGNSENLEVVNGNYEEVRGNTMIFNIKDHINEPIIEFSLLGLNVSAVVSFVLSGIIKIII